MARLVATLICLLAVSCAGGVNKERFDDVYRAGKAIEGSLSVGVTMLKFAELVQEFATEVSIASDKAESRAEKEMVGHYAEALSACQDSLTIWNTKIKKRGNLDVSVNPELRRIVDAYPIQGKGGKEYFNFDPDAAIQVIWSQAGGRLAAANRLYNGESE
jgi:hypothetical protein